MNKHQGIRRPLTAVTKYPVMVIISLAVALSIWGMSHVYDSMIPLKDEWVKQRSTVWFNWVKPCHYYRFQSHEAALVVNRWFVTMFSQNDSWRRTMHTDSMELGRILRLQHPACSQKILSQLVNEWSTPILGSGFGMESNHPFFLLIHTKHESPTSNRVAHIRVFEMPDEGSVIEIWENITINQ